MSSAIYMAGRLVLFSGKRPLPPPPILPTDAPGVEPTPPDPPCWTDALGIRYRWVTQFQNDEAWMLLDKVMAWYGVDEATVAAWAAAGHLDAAVLRGSSVGRFRVRAPAVLDAQAKSFREKNRRKGR